jgi:hypothetical protein
MESCLYRGSPPLRSVIRPIAIMAGCLSYASGCRQQASPSVEGLFVETENPSLAVSGDQSEPFFRIERIVPLSGGGFAVASRSSPSLTILDSRGHVLRRLGRQGGGPGEFTAISGLHLLPPDTLIVFDLVKRRLTTYTVSGDLVDVVQLAEPPGPFFSAYTLRAATPNVLVFVPEAVPVLPRQRSGLVLESLPILLFSRTGMYLAELGPRWRLEVFTDSRRAIPRPFGSRTSVAVHGDLVYVTVPEEPRVEVWTVAGQRAGAIEWRSEERTIGKRARAAFIAEHAASVPAIHRKAAVALLRSVPFPKAFPHHGHIILSDDGREILVEIPNTDRRTRYQQWLVMDSAGQLLGGYRLPRRFRLHAVTSTALAGVWVDSMGAEHLYEYPRAALTATHLAQE